MASPAWSFTSISAFETCPLQYKLLRVDKVVKETPSEAMTWGNTVHKALEERIRDDKPLPKTLAGYEHLAAKIAGSKGEVLVEQKLTLNEKFEPTSWFAKDAWCRGVLDVNIIGKRKAVTLDWKTGKRKDDLEQLKLFAAMIFAHYPDIGEVDTGFVWLKDNAVDREMFTREQVGDIWGTFLPKVAKLNAAFETGRWQARPSGLCRNHCPVGKSNCEFCGK